MSKLRVGLHAGLQNCSFPELSALWRDAEAAGFDWVSVWDHFYPASDAIEGANFESVSTHGALAALTSTPRVGCLVYSVGFRHPAVLANAAATIDHISGGRLELGLGAGWLRAEYDAYGLPFESPGTRIRRLEEAVTVVRSLWANETTDFDGEFYTLREARCEPKPLQASPRIWVGGWGEKKMLPLVGRVADGWNAAFVAPGTWGEKLEAIRTHAAAAGRDPGDIEAAVNVGVAISRTTAGVAAKRERLPELFGSMAQFLEPGILLGTPDAALEHAMRYVEAGAGWLILAMRAPFDREAFELFVTDVLPHLPRGDDVE